ncbi:MAG: serine hydrolase [Dactylosporangium sp.]|nr:class A beta-lactamase-related serine hydrolase [Dactylosporangium sp.]NNJ61508.1 serine hydrolase [Dactylosporangium sp.]
MSRRTALGLGVGLGATAAVAIAGRADAAVGVPTAKDPACQIRGTYLQQRNTAGGVWHSHIAAVDASGALAAVVDDDADCVTHGYSVQKLAVATAVMDKVDRGELSLGQRLDLPASIILGGSGIYHLHSVWGDDITIANFLTAMLLVSDNTAVRMCGRVVPALEINEILAAKGFVNTRVEPVANPNRFYLGTTTPREMHDLLWRLANKTLLSASSCDFLLTITRWVNGYHDGIRRTMSSDERSRVATKYGADYNTQGASRHEAGIMFSTDGAPVLTYALFADGLGDLDNYGATHPAVEAHAVLGRTMFDAISTTAVPPAATRHRVPGFRAVDGG